MHTVILLQTLRQGQLHAMQGFILYYGFQYYGFLEISSALVRSLKEVLDYITKPAHFILFRIG